MTKIKQFAMIGLTALLIINNTFLCFANEDTDAPADSSALDAGKTIEVETNNISGWPQGPIIGADSAILMDADSGVILYQKNINAKEYQAAHHQRRSSRAKTKTKSDC